MRFVAAALFSPLEDNIVSRSSGISSRVGGLVGVLLVAPVYRYKQLCEKGSIHPADDWAILDTSRLLVRLQSRSKIKNALFLTFGTSSFFPSSFFLRLKETLHSGKSMGNEIVRTRFNSTVHCQNKRKNIDQCSLYVAVYPWWSYIFNLSLWKHKCDSQ